MLYSSNLHHKNRSPWHMNRNQKFIPILACPQPTLLPSTSICTPPKSTGLAALAFCTRAGSQGSGFLL